MSRGSDESRGEGAGHRQGSARVEKAKLAEGRSESVVARGERVEDNVFKHVGVVLDV